MYIYIYMYIYMCVCACMSRISAAATHAAANCCCNAHCSTLQHTLCTNGSSIEGQDFSKVSSLSHILYKMAIELTF